MDDLGALFTRIEEGYDEGKPLYLIDNRQTTPSKKSVFKIISEAEFVALEPSEVQNILREQHIVVTGMQHKVKNFEEALLEIADLDWTIPIQGGYNLIFTSQLTDTRSKTIPFRTAPSGLV